MMMTTTMKTTPFSLLLMNSRFGGTMRKTAQKLVVLLVLANMMNNEVMAYRHIGRRELLASFESSTCTDDYGEVQNNNYNATMTSIELYSEEEEPNFLRPKNLKPGDLANVVRRDTKTNIHPDTFFIGLPEELTKTFQNYIKESGIMDLANKVLYEDPVQAGEERFYKLNDGTTWGVRTSANWVESGDMTWIDPADEWTYEVIVDMYRKAGFDTVLDTLGEKFGSGSLYMDLPTFVVVSHFEGSNIHVDLEGLAGYEFNVLYPLVIPENGGGTLELAGSDDDEMWTEGGLGASFQFHQGIVVDGESPHGTGNVDYRQTGEFRMAVAVYINEVTEDNVDEFDDDTSSFPPSGDMDYLLSQAGRHWGGMDQHTSLKMDKGRKSYLVEDDDPKNCPEWKAQGLCMKDVKVRNSCLKSCEIILEDEVYYSKLRELLNPWS